MKTIAVLTSGGDAPGMNAAVRAVAKVGAGRGVRVLGVRNGYDGLIDGQFRELTRAGPSATGLVVDPDIDMAGSLGGTLLGSARCARFRTPEGRAQAFEHVRSMEGLVIIGGDGSLTGAHLWAKESGVRFIGIPASIDNDIGCTGTAIGVDTALNTIVDACDRISDTALSHRRAFVVEVMGRHSGYLAIAGAVAAGADGVLFREQGRNEEELVAAVADQIRRGFGQNRDKRRILILKAEGVEVPCTRLVRSVQDALDRDTPGIEVRATVLGHLVRGGRPSFADRMVAGRMGLLAVELLLAGETDQMLAWQATVQGGATTSDPVVRRFPMELVLEETKKVLDGTSVVTRWRTAMMEKLEGVLGL